MPGIVVDNVVRVACLWRLDNGEPAVNVVHVKREEASSREVAEEVRDACQDHLLDPMSDTVSFEGVEYVDLNTIDGETGFVAPDPAKPLHGSHDLKNAGAQISVVAVLGPSDRAHRKGRMYLPGLCWSQSDDTGTFLTDSALDEWQDALDAFSDAVNDSTPEANIQLGWVSIIRPAFEPVFRPADDHDIRRRLATQRRRINAGTG